MGHVLSHKQEELIHGGNCSLFCAKKDHSREKTSGVKVVVEQTAKPTFLPMVTSQLKQ